jgi:UDP-N-acetylmuramate--alanine ligase
MIDLGGPKRKVHVVGIGGSGMNAIAQVLQTMGHHVSGSDLHPSARLARLKAIGIEATVGHDAVNVGDADMVAVSSAIAPDNPEVMEAHRRGVPVLRRAEILAAIVACRRTVAVAGTHGKTSTSAMLALMLRDAGMRPSFLVGGDIKGLDGGAAWDDGEWLVVEADESDGTFLELGAEAVIVTSIEPDHLDYWGGFSRLRDAFRRFVLEAPGPRLLGADDPVSRQLSAEVEADTYGLDPSATWRIVDVIEQPWASSFRLEGPVTIPTVHVPVAGLHNVHNAAGALAMAVSLGADSVAAGRALAAYQGVARRYEFRGECRGVTFVDDYAHLPSEVASALAAARAGRWKRIVAVFQPHRYSRTEAIGPTFGDAFLDADVVVVTAIYSHDEPPRPGVSSRLVVDAVLDAHPQQRVAWIPDRSDLVQYLVDHLRPGDLRITLGAGDLTTLADEVMAAMA